MSKWTPQNDDPALTLAAIRWYGMSIEKLAMDLYLTNKEQYPSVKDILSTAVTELGKLRGYCAPNAEKAGSQSAPVPKMMSLQAEGDEDGCGPGYVNCNGICLPECDNIAEY